MASGALESALASRFVRGASDALAIRLWWAVIFCALVFVGALLEGVAETWREWRTP